MLLEVLGLPPFYRGVNVQGAVMHLHAHVHCFQALYKPYFPLSISEDYGVSEFPGLSGGRQGPGSCGNNADRSRLLILLMSALL